MLRMACFSTSRIKLFVFIAALFLSAELRNNFQHKPQEQVLLTLCCIAMLIKDYCVFKNIVLLFDLSAVSEKRIICIKHLSPGFVFFLLCYRSFLLRIYDFSLSYSNDFPLSF